MSHSIFKSCSFSLEPLHNQAQELSIEFLNEETNLFSKKTFHFYKEDSFVEEQEIFDICSQNGICREPLLDKLFQNRDVQDTKKILKVAEEKNAEGIKIFTLDLKDEELGYLRTHDFNLRIDHI
ncbi:MAG: hypothetical protein V4494_04900 [Chlamydiota bacterium]